MLQDKSLAGPTDAALRERNTRSLAFSLPAIGLHYALLAGILVLGLALGALRLHPFTAAYGDEARFLMLAESMLFHGDYTLPSAQGFVAEHQYPPGIPALFAFSMWLTGTGDPLASAIVPAKLTVLLIYLAGLVCSIACWRVTHRAGWRLQSPWRLPFTLWRHRWLPSRCQTRLSWPLASPPCGFWIGRESRGTAKTPGLSQGYCGLRWQDWPWGWLRTSALLASYCSR